MMRFRTPRTTILLLSLNFLTGLCGAQAQVGPRDLSKYLTIGPYVGGYGHPEFIKQKPDVRQFLWESFQKQLRAHVVITTQSLEADRQTFSYFVEPDSNGIWHIHITRELTWPNRIPGQSGIFHKTEEYDIYALERLTIQGEQVVTDSEAISPDLYKLRFILKDGKRIWDF